MDNFKILSGGQAGISRGALDAALALNVLCGGWCAQAARDGLGDFPEHYPLEEKVDPDEWEGVRRNVLDSDASAIIYYRVVEGSAEETLDDCVQQGKPYRLIDADELQPGQAAKILSDFIKDCGAFSLNVVGPQSLDDVRGHKYGQDVVRLLVETLRRKNGGKRNNGKRSRHGETSKSSGLTRTSQTKPNPSRRRNRKKSRSKAINRVKAENVNNPLNSSNDRISSNSPEKDSNDSAIEV